MSKNSIILVLVVCLGFVACAVVGYSDGYNAGWGAHSAKVNADYQAEQEKAQRQQANNVEKGAKADAKGSVEYQTITKEVTKYVSRPGAVKCDFDADRVRIKQRAVANANAIEGYDDPAVSVPVAVE